MPTMIPPCLAKRTPASFFARPIICQKNFRSFLSPRATRSFKHGSLRPVICSDRHQKAEGPRGIAPQAFLCSVRQGSPRAHQPCSRLAVHPELSVGPGLVDARTQVLLDIAAGKQVAISGLESHFAVHEHVGPREVDFLTDVLLGVAHL